MLIDIEEELKNPIFSIYVLVAKKSDGSYKKIVHSPLGRDIQNWYKIARDNPEFVDFEVFRFSISQDGLDYCQTWSPEGVNDKN